MIEKGLKQGFDAQIFKKAIRLAAGTHDLVHVKIFDATVISGSQNSDTMTCFVDSQDSSILGLEVRYNLCISDGLVCVPDDDSVVTIAMTAFTDPYIVKFTDLISNTITVVDTVIHQENGEVIVSQGSNPVEDISGIKLLLSNSKLGISNETENLNLLTILQDILTQIQTIAQQLIIPSNILTPTGNGQFIPDVVTEITNAYTSIISDSEKLNQLLQ